MKKFFYLVVLVGFLLQTTIVLAQAQEVHAGCNIAWSAPMVEDLPDNPGVMISAWEKAGDLKGFVFNTRKDDQHVWDKLLEQKFEDPALLEIPCPMIGVEDVGTYSVGITAEDFALNQSAPAWITFNLVPQDNTALDPVAEICMKGMHNGQPIETCQRAIVP